MLGPLARFRRHETANSHCVLMSDAFLQNNALAVSAFWSTEQLSAAFPLSSIYDYIYLRTKGKRTNVSSEICVPSFKHEGMMVMPFFIDKLDVGLFFLASEKI